MAITTEILIVGGGPAGSQAALSLGRVHRDVVMLDHGRYRNESVEHMHNVLGRDGTEPRRLREQSRAELEHYPTVSVLSHEAVGIDGDAETGFTVALDDGGAVRAAAVILATGLIDELPEVPGLAELWGGRAAQCPFCHAHEFAGGRFGVLGGDFLEHRVGMLAPIAGSVVVLPLATDASDVELENCDVAAAPVSSITSDDDGVVVALEDGGEERVDVVFVAPKLRQHSDLPAQLGLELNDSGCVRVDEFSRTSVAGVFAAGDMAHLAAYPMPPASVVTAMSTGMTAAASSAQQLLTASH